MNQEHKVAIITPAYNSSDFITETIESVINQTYTNWEWWIVDDASKDDIQPIVDSFNDSRINLIKLEKNQGAAGARNEGIKKASGRFLSFIDSDDVWLANKLETCVNYLLTNKLPLVYTSYFRFDEAMENQPIQPFIAKDKVKYKDLYYTNPIFISTVVMDTEIVGFPLIPLVDEREDHAYWMSVLEKIPEARAIKEPLVKYRMRKNSVSRDKWKIAKKQFKMYRTYNKLSLPAASFYTFCWAFNGFLKYLK